MSVVLNKYKATSEELKNSVYIGRGSKWGNRFVIGKILPGTEHALTREDVIGIHRMWIFNSIEGQKLQEDLPELRGKNLICFCAPQNCHGDLYLEEANK